MQFQSAPGGEAGGNQDSGRKRGPGVQFQSAPGGEAGGNPDVHPQLTQYGRFNPPPAVRPGETATRHRPQKGLLVSIRPRR